MGKNEPYKIKIGYHHTQHLLGMDMKEDEWKDQIAVMHGEKWAL